MQLILYSYFIVRRQGRLVKSYFTLGVVSKFANVKTWFLESNLLFIGSSDREMLWRLNVRRCRVYRRNCRRALWLLYVWWQQVQHVRSLCLNSSRANRIRQSYKIAGQLRRSRSQCTSKLLLRMHSVASSTDDAHAQSSNSSNNSSTGVKLLYTSLADWLARWLASLYSLPSLWICLGDLVTLCDLVSYPSTPRARAWPWCMPGWAGARSRDVSLCHARINCRQRQK